MRACTLLVAVLFTSVVARSQQPVILHNATVIDGTGSPAREHVDITLRRGLIESVSPASQAHAAGASVIDCTGKTVIPGLVSAHSHLGVLLRNSRKTERAPRRQASLVPLWFGGAGSRPLRF